MHTAFLRWRLGRALRSKAERSAVRSRPYQKPHPHAGAGVSEQGACQMRHSV